ncbi:hypothetical protein K469DRAFT_628588, partial [Zopfia rhizophila CBS 207.26]
MSDSGATSGAAATTTSQFTERELQLLGWAMQSLKSGPPDVDYNKLAEFAGMSNPRSAANAWAKIRTKLMAGDGIGAKASPTKSTPRKGKGAANVKTEQGEEANGGEDTEETPKKSPRKRASKNQGFEGEGSPKKK